MFMKNTFHYKQNLRWVEMRILCTHQAVQGKICIKSPKTKKWFKRVI